MNIVNLTPHSITLCDDAGKPIRVIEPTKPAARVLSTVRVVDEVDGIPITETAFGAVEGLPAPSKDTVYIVSLLVQQAVPQRQDVFRPDTGSQSVVRDSAGQIFGVRALAK